MLIRVLSVLLAIVTAARSQDNKAKYPFLLACTSGTVSGPLIFLFFQSTGCECTVISNKNYTIINEWPNQSEIYVKVLEEERKCSLEGDTKTWSIGNSANATVYLDSSVDQVTKQAFVALESAEENATVTAKCRDTTRTQRSTLHFTTNTETYPGTTIAETSASITQTSSAPLSAASGNGTSHGTTTLDESTARHNETGTPTESTTAGNSDENPSDNSTTGLGDVTTEKSSRSDPAHGVTGKRTGDDLDQPINTMSLVVLAVGGVLFLLAATVIILSALWYRRRKQESDREARGRDAGTSDGRQRHGDHMRDGRPQGRLDTSKASLLEQHNYEDVSEDGVSGSSGGFVLGKSSQQQPVPLAPAGNNYSRIAGHARQASGGSMSVSSHRAEKAEAPDGDDYNTLNLQASARSNDALTKTPLKADTEDDDYMEIGGDDIYEAVDDDGTPLCPRKARPPPVGAARPPREDYTDCVSTQGLDQCDKSAVGDAHVIFIGKAKKQQSVEEGSKASKEKTVGEGTNSPVIQHTLKARSKKPTPPLSSPPAAPPASSRQSKSAEDLTSDRQGATRSSGKHKHTKSVDLIHPNYQNAAISPPGFNPTITDSAKTQPKTRPTFEINGNPLAENSKVNPNSTANQTPQNITNGAPATSLRQKPAKTTASPLGDVPSNPEQVVMRPKSRARATNLELLAFQETVRGSMEINDEEMVMIDNILYGTLPRNMSLPTTEL